jgi:hypothetical protein
MYCKEYTIGKTEFLTIHNALCKLQWHEDAAVKAAVETIRQGLDSAYRADEAACGAKIDYYDSVKKELQLTTIWSIFEVDDIHSEHPYRGAQTLVYKDHWGGKPVSKPVLGATWAHLWVAAEAAIKASGDGHHYFIEGFRQAGDELFLTTGS